MRNDLNCPAKIIVLPLLFNDMLVDLSGRDVVFARQSDVEVPFVVFEVKIYFTAKRVITGDISLVRLSSTVIPLMRLHSRLSASLSRLSQYPKSHLRELVKLLL
jgi:hypothetical protein